MELINGQPGEQVSSHDRGLLYGDGLFETMAVVAGQIPLWSWHFDRLQRSCMRLKLACPSREVLESEIARLVGSADRAVLKLILTRGTGGRGYTLPDEVTLTRILQRHSWPDVSRNNWETGVKVIFCEQGLARPSVLAGIKHLNRLEQVLARSEWQDPAIQEGLMADSDGNIIEAVSHNLFVLKGDHFITPGLQDCGVAGIMREYIFTLLQEKGYSVKISALSKAAVLAADAAFLCNSVHGIWPICELDGKSYLNNRLVCELRDTVAQVIPYP